MGKEGKWASPNSNHITTVSTGSPPVVGLPGEQGSRETCVWGDPLWLMEPWCCLGRLGRCWVSLHLLHLLWSSCCTWKQMAQLGPHFGKPQSTGSDWLKGSYLSVQEAVEHSHHKPLRDVERERPVSVVPFVVILSWLHLSHTYTHLYLCGWQRQLCKGPYLKHRAVDFNR